MKMKSRYRSPKSGHISMTAQTLLKNRQVSGKRASQSEVTFRTILRNGGLALAVPLIMIQKASYIMLLLLVIGLMMTALVSPVQTISRLALLLALLILIISNLSAWFVMIVAGFTNPSTTTALQTLRQRPSKH